MNTTSASTAMRQVATALILFSLALAPSAQQPSKTPDADWPMYARDLAGTKYSPLTQINADNVSKLTVAWNVTLVERPTTGRDPAAGRNRAPADEEAAPQILSNPEVTPIV